MRGICFASFHFRLRNTSFEILNTLRKKKYADYGQKKILIDGQETVILAPNLFTLAVKPLRE